MNKNTVREERGQDTYAIGWCEDMAKLAAQLNGGKLGGDQRINTGTDCPDSVCVDGNMVVRIPVLSM